VQDYASRSFSLKAHPVSFVRPKLDKLKAVPAKRMSEIKDGAPVKLAGLVLVRQRPPTAKGVVFVTVEDETGIANLILFKDVFEKFRRDLLSAKLLMVDGILERESDVVHIVAKRLYNLSPWLRELSRPEEDFSLLAERGAESVIPEARNFK
jgi:error-prone DNA polymerase